MNLSAFASAFRTPDLRNKLLFTMGILALYRLGAVTPTPGIDYGAAQSCIASVEGNSLYGLINLFSRRRTAPTVDLRPRDHALHHREHHPAADDRGDPQARGPQEGGPVRAGTYHPVRATSPWRWPLQSTGIIALARTPGQLFQGCSAQLIPDDSIFTIFVMIATMTAGTAVIMWLGELITDRGVATGCRC